MATLLERLFAPFRAKPSPPLLDTYEDANTPNGTSSSDPASVTAAPAPDSLRVEGQEKGFEKPYWLDNEDILRDEGVLFGLSESEATEKVEVIRKYFAYLATDSEQALLHQNEQIQELNLFIGQKETYKEALETKISEAEAALSPTARESPLGRIVLGLALSVAMCAANFSLIDFTLRPAFGGSPLIPLGVFLAGMFNLFGRYSLFHQTESRFSPRILLEEVGMPLAAAFFVFVHAWAAQPPLVAFSLFVFVFFIFLFAGKLLLSTVSLLGKELPLYFTGRRQRKENKANLIKWEEEVKQLTQEINELRVERWKLVHQQTQTESTRDKLYAQRDTLIHLFESEFSLARRMKHLLTSKELRTIQGQ